MKDFVKSKCIAQWNLDIYTDILLAASREVMDEHKIFITFETKIAKRNTFYDANPIVQTEEYTNAAFLIFYIISPIDECYIDHPSIYQHCKDIGNGTYLYERKVSVSVGYDGKSLESREFTYTQTFHVDALKSKKNENGTKEIISENDSEVGDFGDEDSSLGNTEGVYSQHFDLFLSERDEEGNDFFYLDPIAMKWDVIFRNVMNNDLDFIRNYCKNEENEIINFEKKDTFGKNVIDICDILKLKEMKQFLLEQKQKQENDERKMIDEEKNEEVSKEKAK